jgi:hypothetical protein
MALITPDYLQTKSYAAKRDRRVNQALTMQEGIVHAGDFKVTQRGAGANMSVDVASGESWVDGDSAVDQGFYHVVNDATVNVAIANNASGNPRIDTLVLKVNDSADAGSGTDIPALEIIQGTPTAAATLANLKGIAALPNTALRLAYILVANGAVKIENAQIGNLKDPRAGLTGYPAKAEPEAVTLAPAQYAHGRPLDYIPSARAYSSVTTAQGAEAEIPFDTELYDNDEIHSLVENKGRLVAKTPGVYYCSITGVPEAAANLYIGVNGAGVANRDLVVTALANSAASVSGGIRLGFGDYVVGSVNNPVKVFTVNKTPTLSIIWQGP